jgi:hypothetical protein
MGQEELGRSLELHPLQYTAPLGSPQQSLSRVCRQSIPSYIYLGKFLGRQAGATAHPTVDVNVIGRIPDGEWMQPHLRVLHVASSTEGLYLVSRKKHLPAQVSVQNMTSWGEYFVHLPTCRRLVLSSICHNCPVLLIGGGS